MGDDLPRKLDEYKNILDLIVFFSFSSPLALVTFALKLQTYTKN